MIPRFPWRMVPFLLVALLSTNPSMASHPGAGAAAPLDALSSSHGTPCPGPMIADQYPGSLGVDAPFGTPPAVANRTVHVDYWYQSNVTSATSGTTISCLARTATAVTGGNGSFVLPAGIPNGSCTVHACTQNSGPFGPARFGVNATDPPGDTLRVTRDGTRVVLYWTAALAAVAISPWGRQVLSTDAPTNFTAVGSAGDGGPSPATLDPHWVISGADWSLIGASNGTTTRIEASDGAASGSLRLDANGSLNGTFLGMPPFVDALEAVPTSLSTGTLAPTSVDAGDPVSVALTGEGAAGYAYSAFAAPGLAVPAVALPCTVSAPNLQSVVSISCRGSFSYPSAGVAQPWANLSNGYSTARWTFPQVVVASALTVTMTPDPAAGYRNEAIPFVVGVASGSGTPPYGPACLAPGTGALECASVGSTSWSLGYAYTTDGSYTAVASVVDGAGANHTRSVPVHVADPPGLSSLSTGTNRVAAGSTISITAYLSGGLWPARYWWNDSDPNGTLRSGALGSDGTLGLTQSFPWAGLHQITLTVVDALGTRVASSTALDVASGPANGLRCEGGTLLPDGAAGAVLPLHVRAVDAVGSVAGTFADPLVLTALGPSGALDVNGSPAPVVPSGNGSWAVPGSAWAGGWLNLTYSSREAGRWNLSLSDPRSSSIPTLRVTVSVVADGRHPRLVGAPGERPSGRSSDTHWTVEDPYGNPVVDGYVVVRSVFASGSLSVDSPILDQAGVGGVWVNYTALDDGAGTVHVLDEQNESLLPAIAVPAAAAAMGSSEVLPVLALLGLVTVGGILLVLRFRPRPARPGGSELEGELERHAAGRTHLLQRLSEGPASSLEDLEGAWEGPPPRPEPSEIVEWMAALLTEGVVSAEAGPGGAPRFVLTAERSEAPGLTLDDAALERALARRDEEPDPRDPGGACAGRDPGRSGGRGDRRVPDQVVVPVRGLPGSEAVPERSERLLQPPHLRGDRLGGAVPMEEPVEELRDPVHLLHAHADPGQFRGAEPDPLRPLRARVAGQEVLVRDDADGGEAPGDLLPAALGAHPDGEGVGGGESEGLRQHVEAPGVERRAQRPGVLDRPPGVLPSEGEVLGQADGEGGHGVQVMVGGDAREGGPLQPLHDLRVVGLSEEDPVLRTGEGLVRRGRDHHAALPERVLELAAGDEAQHVGRIVPALRADLLQRRPELGDGEREEEEGEPEEAELRPDGLEDLPGPGNVEGHPVRVPGIVDRFHRPEAEGAEGGARDVRPVRQPGGADEIAGLGEGLQDGEVRHRPGDGTDVGEGAAEEALREVEADPLHLVDLLVPLVVPLSGEPLGVPGMEVTDEELLRIRGEQVLRGDERQRVLEPLRVGADRRADPLDGTGHLGADVRCRSVLRRTPPPLHFQWNPRGGRAARAADPRAIMTSAISPLCSTLRSEAGTAG